MKAALALAAVLVAACAVTDGATSFEQAIEDGASCQELFDIRNEVDPDHERIPEWNQQLRDIGCHSSGSTRTD